MKAWSAKVVENRKPDHPEVVPSKAKSGLDPFFSPPVFESYLALSLAVRPEAIQAQLAYLDEQQFPQARNADPREFFDNSFVENLERSGFFQKIGFVK